MTRSISSATTTCLVLLAVCAIPAAADVVHDAEHYVLKAQNAERWASEDSDLDAKLAELRQKHGQPPNIVYILWDDTPFGDVGIPHLQKIRGFETPRLNKPTGEAVNAVLNLLPEQLPEPFTGLSNARPETAALAEQPKALDYLPFNYKELLEHEIPWDGVDPGLGQ